MLPTRARACARATSAGGSNASGCWTTEKRAADLQHLARRRVVCDAGSAVSVVVVSSSSSPHFYLSRERVLMFLKLSADELRDGTTFILQLPSTGSGGRADADDASSGDDAKRVQWAETLRGETAKRWFQIYRLSDWTTLRADVTARSGVGLVERAGGAG